MRQELCNPAALFFCNPCNLSEMYSQLARDPIWEITRSSQAMSSAQRYQTEGISPRREIKSQGPQHLTCLFPSCCCRFGRWYPSLEKTYRVPPTAEEQQRAVASCLPCDFGGLKTREAGRERVLQTSPFHPELVLSADILRGMPKRGKIMKEVPSKRHYAYLLHGKLVREEEKRAERQGAWGKLNHCRYCVLLYSVAPSSKSVFISSQNKNRRHTDQIWDTLELWEKAKASESRIWV